MDANRMMEIEAEMASVVVNACGNTGVLKAVNNDKLSGDVKIRHKKALNEASKFADKDGNVNPNIQAIFARMYGLI